MDQMSRRPLVSVVMPAYNCAPFIGETLQSVYRQTYDHWEVIVINDGSTDETAAVLGPHLRTIRYFYQENHGASAARNAAVRQARGELVAFLDADDVWLPEMLEVQVGVMQRAPECGLVFSDGKTLVGTRIRDESLFSRRLEPWIRAHGTGDPLVAKGSLIRELSFWNEIVTSGVMVRRDCFEAVGGFDEQITIAEDYDLWLRIARRYPMAAVRRSLWMYRWRDDSLSGPAEERLQRWTEGRLRVMEKQLPLAPADLRAPLRVHMARQYWECARSSFDADRFLEARRLLVSCLRHDRTFVPAMMFLLACGFGRPAIHVARRAKRMLRQLISAVGEVVS
jgi:glycosyltransferase involved in cell wall biosynthesis